MNLSRFCQKAVVTIRPSDEVTTAARLMREKHVGYLVVVEPAIEGEAAKPVGVLTDRDIAVAVVAREIDPRSVRVDDVMTRYPVVAAQEDALASALQVMRRLGVRRLPIVDGSGNLAGILSLDDVVDAVAGELQDVAGSIRHELKVETALRA